MTWLKQSTAVTVPIGPFVDDTDGKTTETGLTISQADIRLSKNGGAFAQTNNAAGATHMENGWYGVPLNTTDTGTLGELVVNVNEGGALQAWARFMVVPANVWDSFFGASVLSVNATQLSGDATAADNAESFFDGTGYAGTNNVIPLVTTTTTATNVTTVNGLAANVITATSINTGAITSAKFAAGAIDAAAIAADAIGASELAADAVTEIQSGLATAASIVTLSGKVDTVDDFLDTEIAAIKAVTDLLPNAGALTSLATAASIAALNNVSLAGILASGDVDGFTVEQTLKLILAMAAGKLSGAATATNVIRAADDSKDRITATVDASGNRSAITLDAAG